MLLLRTLSQKEPRSFITALRPDFIVYGSAAAAAAATTVTAGARANQSLGRLTSAAGALAQCSTRPHFGPGRDSEQSFATRRREHA